MPDSLSINKYIKQWEINRGTRDQYENLYRSYKTKEPFAKSTVLSKCEDLYGRTPIFGTTCPPSYCFWYISYKQKSNIRCVIFYDQLDSFVTKIENKYDAYFWIINANSVGNSQEEPLKITQGAKYKIVKDGFLVNCNMWIIDCPTTQANLTFFVGRNKMVVLIQEKIIYKETGCI